MKEKGGLFLSFTIKDIAKLAGVSHATVSRVINNAPNIRPETYESVMRVIQKHGYSPKTSARSLNSGKNYAIGMLILYDVFASTFPTDFIPGILKGISDILVSSEYTFSLYWDIVKDADKRYLLDQKMDQNLDGLLVLGIEPDEQLAFRLAKFHIPIVLINHHFEQIAMFNVTTDDYAGSQEATKHLLELGHRQIVFVEGDPRYQTSNQRKHGFFDAMEKAGVPVSSDLVLRGNYSQEEAYDQICGLIARGGSFSAVFASNDIMALGVIRALNENQLRVPEDVSVIGFDDTEFASMLTPPLTTIRKPRVRLGAESARVMLSILKDEKDAPNSVVLPTELVVRDSTKEIL